MKFSSIFLVAVLAAVSSARPNIHHRHVHQLAARDVKESNSVSNSQKTPLNVGEKYGYVPGPLIPGVKEEDPVKEAEDTEPTATFAASVATQAKTEATVVPPPVVAVERRADREPKPLPVGEPEIIEVKPHLEKRGPVTVTNLFVPIATGKPSALFAARDSLPVKPVGVADKDVPLQTNKFYGNLLIGDRDKPIYPMPYSVWWNRGAGVSNGKWGLGIGHGDDSEKVPVPKDWSNPDTSPLHYYYTVPRNLSLSLSAKEFDAGKATMETDSLKQFSVGMTIWANKGVVDSKIRINLCQGAGLVGGQYTNLKPAFDSDIGIKSVTPSHVTRPGLVKYRVVLNDGKIWAIYAVGNRSIAQYDFTLTQTSPTRIESPERFWGWIQVAKISDAPNAVAENIIDSSAGAACVNVRLSASVSGTSGRYTFNFDRQPGAIAANLLIYAYPHHLSSFDSNTRKLIRNDVKLASLSKGMMTGVYGNSWTLTENNLQTNVGWFPTARNGATGKFTAAKMTQLVNILKKEAVEDMKNQTGNPELYYNGKAYAKFAQVCLVAKDVVKDNTIAKTCLESLKKEYARYKNNNPTNGFKFIYDYVWRGVVPVTAYNTSDPYLDWGAGRYNDHHFQYGYFVYAGAVIAYLDKAIYGNSNWLNSNKAYIDYLARDYSNPSPADQYFPEFRSFNFFDGHSWATGLFDYDDGKNQESSSEDVFAHYALKMWGIVSGNQALEGLATLQISILKRALNEYFVLTPGVSKGHPERFNVNRVVGILYQNKAAHETFFGNEIHKIQGIHMIPFNPLSTFIKTADWAQEEWSLYFNGRTSHINDGWKGILYNNVCLWDPAASWPFFTQNNFRKEWLDNGASRSWYLAVAGMMGGAAV